MDALDLGIKIRMPFHNSCANIKFYQQSITGVVQDFIICFNEEHVDICLALSNTSGLLEQLIGTNFKDRTVFARLVAKVNCFHVNQETRKLDERSYHFPLIFLRENFLMCKTFTNDI